MSNHTVTLLTSRVRDDLNASYVTRLTARIRDPDAQVTIQRFVDFPDHEALRDVTARLRGFADTLCVAVDIREKIKPVPTEEQPTEPPT